MISLTSIVPLPYRIGAYVLLLVSAVGFGFIKGITYDSDRHTKEVVALQQKVDEQTLHTAQVIDMQNKISNGAVNEYENRIASINSYYSRLLNGSYGSSLPTLPPGTSQIDAASAYNKLAASCASTTAQLIALQDWIKAQENVK